MVKKKKGEERVTRKEERDKIKVNEVGGEAVLKAGSRTLPLLLLPLNDRT